MSFWNFKASDKWSELEEGRHNRLLRGALHDPDTEVTEYDRFQFILFDKTGTEALLFRPRSIVTRVGMRLFNAVLRLIPNSQTPQ